jgi:hypothetical protein
MARFSNVILAAAGAALIAIGIGAQTGTFAHTGLSGFHMPSFSMPSFSSAAKSAPKHAGVASESAPEVPHAPRERVNPAPAPVPVIVSRGGEDHDDGDD